MHDETFRVERGALIRDVITVTGKTYRHRCPQAAYEAVAHAVEALPADGFNQGDLKAAAGVPWSQAGVAFAFMRERGVVVPVFPRKHRPASTFAFEDAMIEFHALREGDVDG